ncbi:MAG: SIS domain-containing protein [Hungatella hathewayi]|nr:SIS domain-containing protein [Hungatella hathewayi]
MLNRYAMEYHHHIVEIMGTIVNESGESIEKAAQAMLKCWKNGGNIFAFGPGHAGMFAEEMFYRAGGLAVTNPLFHSGLMCNERPITLTSALEVLPGYATVILNESQLKAGDCLLIHSVAARNPVVVEMAAKARKKGIFVIGIINMDYATQVTSRDPSGKMMYDECDIVIDTKGDLGDSCIDMEQVEQKVAPTSSVLGTFIANLLILQLSELMLNEGMKPPVYQSANIDGGAEYNAKLMETYKDRIFYL